MLKPMHAYGIGKTPLREAEMLNGNRMFFKLEQHNFLGSIKARTAYGIAGELECPRDMPIVESTSGNLGIAMDFFCKEIGRPFLCLLDDTVIASKRSFLEKSNINFTVVPTEPGYDPRCSRIRYAQRLMDTGSHFWVNQYDNEHGVSVHRKTTGPEIWEQTHGEITCCVCAVGSGGTIVGVGQYLKSRRKDIKIVAVEPYGSTIFGTEDKLYLTAGAGYKGKPGNILRHEGYVDFTYVIDDAVSLEKCRELSRKQRLNVGVTTGMAYVAAELFCRDKRGETVVVVSPDGAKHYNEFI